MLPHDKICALPWVSIEATPTGAMRVCCLSLDEIKHQGQVLSINQGLIAGYKSDSMQLLRKEFLAGKQPDQCQRCWNEESAGRTSKRQWHLIKFADNLNSINWHNTNPDQLWFLDLKLGNICNLKCRICGTWSSSKWAQEEMNFQNPDNPHESRAYTQLKLGQWPRQSSEFWQELVTLLPQVRYFEFTGGEPFLIQEHFDLLQMAVDLGHSHHISLHYNTNGTTWPSTDVWQHFHKVEIAFSIDNTGPKFEVERHGASWAQVEHTLDQARDLRNHHSNVVLQVCVTVNIQNVYYLDEICQWIDCQGFDMVYFNMLHDPWYMNIAHMTTQARSMVLDKLTHGTFALAYQKDINAIVNFINNGAGSDGKEFCDFMRRIDVNRKENFLSSHENIARSMGYGS